MAYGYEGFGIAEPDWLHAPRSANGRFNEVLPWELNRGLHGLGATQRMNSDLPPKLAEVEGQIAALKGLLVQIDDALKVHGPILNSDPSGIPTISAANAAQAAVQGAIDQLSASKWSGQNFGSFQGSTDAWNRMDQAVTATAGVLAANRGIPGALATAAGKLQQAAISAQQAQQRTVSDAAAKVQSALASAQTLASLGNFTAALAALQAQDVVQAANVVGKTADLQNAISIVASQQQAQTQQGDIRAQQTACATAGGMWTGTICDMTQANLLKRQEAQARAACSAAGGQWNAEGGFCDMSGKLAADREAQRLAAEAARQQQLDAQAAAQAAETARWQAQFQAQQAQLDAQMRMQAMQACQTQGGFWDGQSCDLTAVNEQRAAQAAAQARANEIQLTAQFLPYATSSPSLLSRIIAKIFGIESYEGEPTPMASGVPGSASPANISPSRGGYSDAFGEERF